MRQRACFDDHGARKSYPTFSLVVGSSFRGLRSRDDFSFFSEPNLSFAGLQFFLVLFRKKLYSARFDFAVVPLFWRFFEKNCRPPVMSFAIVQLFWRFHEKNGTAPVSILRSYSYFGDFPKKTVQPPF